MAVRFPSTCGLSVAERRDLMVATYSSELGTGEEETVMVCTGRAWNAGAAEAAFLLPQAVSPRQTTSGRENRKMRDGLFKGKSSRITPVIAGSEICAAWRRSCAAMQYGCERGGNASQNLRFYPEF